jgi:hypothetical protein
VRVRLRRSVADAGRRGQSKFLSRLEHPVWFSVGRRRLSSRPPPLLAPARRRAAFLCLFFSSPRHVRLRTWLPRRRTRICGAGWPAAGRRWCWSSPLPRRRRSATPAASLWWTCWRLTAAPLPTVRVFGRHWPLQPPTAQPVRRLRRLAVAALIRTTRRSAHPNQRDSISTAGLHAASGLHRRLRASVERGALRGRSDTPQEQP